MKYIVSKNAYGELIRFSPIDPDCADSELPGCGILKNAEPYTDISVDLLSSCTLNADSDDVYWLYEVCFTDVTLYVTAFDYSDAMVRALLYRGDNSHPTSINEYDVFEMMEEGNGSVHTYVFDDRIQPLLSRLTEANRDFVAHAILYVDGMTEDDLRHFESDHIERTLKKSNCTALDLTADEVRDSCSYIWNNHIIFESTGALLSVIRLHGKHKDETDPMLALIWTYVFEKWAHYDCRLSYTLYRLILDGELDKRLDGFLAEREILE